MGCPQTTSHAAWVSEQGRESQRLRSRRHQRIHRIAQGQGLSSCRMEARQVRQRCILGSPREIYCQHKLRRPAPEFVRPSTFWSISPADLDLSLVWDFKASVLKSSTAFPSSRPSHQVKHNCQTVCLAGPLRRHEAYSADAQGKWVSVFRAQWSPNPDYYPHFTVRTTQRVR